MTLLQWFSISVVTVLYSKKIYAETIYAVCLILLVVGFFCCFFLLHFFPEFILQQLDLPWEHNYYPWYTYSSCFTFIKKMSWVTEMLVFWPRRNVFTVLTNLHTPATGCRHIRNFTTVSKDMLVEAVILE